MCIYNIMYSTKLCVVTRVQTVLTINPFCAITHSILYIRWATSGLMMANVHWKARSSSSSWKNGTSKNDTGSISWSETRPDALSRRPTLAEQTDADADDRSGPGGSDLVPSESQLSLNMTVTTDLFYKRFAFIDVGTVGDRIVCWPVAMQRYSVRRFEQNLEYF